jgi:hypothetical protein
VREVALVAASLCTLAALAVAWCFHHGYILYYGDAQSHLNLSRSILDSRTPGYDQLGTVWLPLLHLICLPLVANDWMWSTGLAGAIPVALCFVIAGTLFYLAAKDAYSSSLAAAIVVSCFALNPNVLYLASIPMTEIVFTAALALLVFALFRFRSTQEKRFVALAILASWSMSLTRYEGWFFVPFAAIAFTLFSEKERVQVLVAFGALGCLAPLYWMAHNWWLTGNALDFYNGPYSPAAIQGARAYPGYHDWLLAAAYYAKAGQLCAGSPLVLLGAIGVFCAAKRKALGPILLLLLTPAFYIWSIHSSQTPIFLPQLPPHNYYNSRYGLAVVVLAAFAAGAIALALPERWRKFAVAVPLIAVAPWLVQSKENWICWKESQMNSKARLAWTASATQFLRSHYRSGQGILTPSASGDVAGAFQRAQIPLRETINVGNGPTWFANTLRPDLVHQALWAVAQTDDAVTNAIDGDKPSAYHLTQQIEVQGAPVLRIYRRIDTKARK